MTIKEIADKLVAYCRKGEFETALSELFSADAVSIEPHETPAFAKETRGLPAILAKNGKWSQMVTEYHSMEVSDPLVASTSFACTLQMDVTMEGEGRMQMNELCVYKVQDGKIISEEFFM